jgi:O-antigen ligase
LLVYGLTFTRFARVLSVVGITAVAVALSRASFLQLLASLAALGVIFPTAFLRMIWRQKASLLLAVLGGTLLVFTPSRAITVVELVQARFAALVASRNLDTEDYSASVRIEIWRSLGREIQSHPASYLFGFGQLGPSFIGAGFTSSEGEDIADYSAHNQYLDTMVRAGVPGVASEVLLMLAVIYYACMGRFQTSAQKRFALANGIALVGVLVFGMFHETLRWNLFAGLFWLFAGWLAAAGSYRWRRSAP